MASQGIQVQKDEKKVVRRQRGGNGVDGGVSVGKARRG